mmetsp:Transcript_22203/g.43198  ORF Transcript_22203/g.43198 Transcript_22203/m.43198 type:complete len:243 (+) Transcript_22203:854-1582(+)
MLGRVEFDGALDRLATERAAADRVAAVLADAVVAARDEDVISWRREAHDAFGRFVIRTSSFVELARVRRRSLRDCRSLVERERDEVALRPSVAQRRLERPRERCGRAACICGQSHGHSGPNWRVVSVAYPLQHVDGGALNRDAQHALLRLACAHGRRALQRAALVNAEPLEHRQRVARCRAVHRQHPRLPVDDHGRAQVEVGGAVGVGSDHRVQVAAQQRLTKLGRARLAQHADAHVPRVAL